jgi:hypothetical protein
MNKVARIKLLTRLAKIRGKCYSFVSSSTLKQKLDTDYTTDENDSDRADTDGAIADDDSINVPTLKARKSRFSKMLADDYICTCCMEILLNPVSLLCGHNICALCLANWFLISSKSICPTCRQEWTGCPKPNIVLK